MAKSYIRTILAMGSLALLAPICAHAQDSDPEETIVVEGAPEVDGSDARQQARDITHPLDGFAEPLARFQGPICPGVWGMRPQNAQLVIDRIYFNAEYVGAPVNIEENCGANVWVIVVDNPAVEFEKLVEKSDSLVRPLTPFERKRVRQQKGPVRAWQLITTRDENGERVATGHEVAGAFAEAKVMGTPPPSLPTTNMSRLRLPIRQDIEVAIVMVERKALASLDAVALADYATMRSLARTEEPEDGEVGEGDVYDTVLSLFGEESPNDRLTVFDRAYLRGVYRSGPYRPARMGVASLKPLMEEELAKGGY